MGAILSLPTSKNRTLERPEASQVDASKKLRMTTSVCSHEHPRLIPGLPDEISLQILARMSRIGYLNAKMVSWSWNAAITGAEVYRWRKELGVSEEWVYILTRTDSEKLSWHAFDPLNNRWQRLPPMPGVAHEGGPKRGITGLRLSDLVSASIRITDVIRGWLGQKDSIDRIPFCGCAIGSVDGCLYVLGGFSRASTMKCVWRYDPCINSWQEVSSMSTGRAFCKTSLLNNKLYVVGGVSKGRYGLTPLQSAEVYDPTTGLWAEVPNMPFSKAQVLPTEFLAELLKPIATGMTSYRGKLCVPQSLYSWPFFVDVGGEIFNPETNSWAEMPTGMGEGWPARQAGTKLTAVVNGDLYALEPSSSSSTGKIKRYDPQEDAWKVAVGRVPVRDYAESEIPYLLAGFLGKLHLIIRDTNNEINIVQADNLELVEPSTDSSSPPANPSCHNPDVPMDQETDTWTVVASKKFAAVELVSCQVLNI